MSLNNFRNQTIALAGLTQSCRLVHQLATTGNNDTEAFAASIGSVLKINSDSVLDIYGGVTGIRFGLEHLERQLAGQVMNNPEQTRYAAQLVYLQKRLAKRSDLLNLISIGVSKAQAQAEHFGVLHVNVQANLADVYQNTISTIPPRIMVVGDQQYLSNQATANKIRALLLAGIRATLLWRQCGGSRWKLLLFRKKLQQEAQKLLAEL
ncbi:high frequency lysogenization protein HflD [Methylomonas paludis]|uniref:High frequency lysogenization protein HflD homolog n=1 Tax=Methylomonas paludis TaxID=1173101 RepID=A0A975R9N0_9GAMM|nr:high frequency lysogenization protein HflD [Methylomonas paludis]QWF71600.1 high frequency lysogenization protein HflD [Methylomonas paludis]